MNKSISRIVTLSNRNLKEILRDPLSLIFIIAMPLVMEILFYFLFHDLANQFQMQYLAPGIVVFSQAFISLFMGLLISIDRGSCFLTRLFVSKAKPYEFIISYTLSLIPIALIQSVLFFLVGGIIDISLFKIEMIYSILISLFTSFFFIGLGVLIGTICNEKSVGGISSIVITAQSLLSGMWFPIEGVDETMIKIMNFLPFKNATLLIQNTLNGFTDIYNDLIYPFIIILIYGVIVFLLAILIFKNKMSDK